MSQAPKTIQYQGKTLYLAEQVTMDISHNPVRYVYVDRAGFPRLMQWDYGQGIDWQRLEAENSEAPKRNEVVDGRTEKWKLYSKTYRAIKKKKSKVLSPELASYLAELERDREAAAGGYSDYNAAFFAQFREMGE